MTARKPVGARSSSSTRPPRKQGKRSSTPDAPRLLDTEETDALAQLAEAWGVLPKQMLFAMEYLKDLNGTRSAVRAGYSPRSASQAASGLLTHPKVSLFLAEAMRQRGARLNMDGDAVLRELSVVARSDVRDFLVNHKGKLTLRRGADDLAWRAVSSVKHRVKRMQLSNGEHAIIREVEVRLWPKVDALRLLREHLGLTRDAGGGTLLEAAAVAALLRQAVQAQDTAESLTSTPTEPTDGD